MTAAGRGERFVVVGTDFQASSLEVLARARLANGGVSSFLTRIAARGVSEVALLSTCNRFELYAATPDPDAAIATLTDELGSVLGEGDGDLVVRRDGDAVAHLVAVAAGLESALLGEHEILGQVRRAYATAVDAGTAGSALTRLFEHAVREGRRIRRTLGISGVRRSLTDLAAGWIASQIADPGCNDAGIVGAGETAAQMARHLDALGFQSLTVLSRRLSPARTLARAVNGSAEPLHRLAEVLPELDVVVLATSANDAILTEAALSGRRRKLLVVDLGLSPNAERGVGRHPAVTMLTLSDVLDIALSESDRERSPAAHADALVQQAVAEFSRARAPRRASAPLRHSRAPSR